MRGKRSKQYRKLMERYSMTFGFREPFQVLVDAGIIADACRYKMPLHHALQRTVHGKVKPMITQCEIRKLYAQKDAAGISEAIEVAKSCKRRRCGHHPDEFPEPLDTFECLQSVVDPKGRLENTHRYVVASQNQNVRQFLRSFRGVPLIYIKRSVMILEPMSDESAQLRAREERIKFRAEIKSTLGKRRRQEVDEGRHRPDEGPPTLPPQATRGDDARAKERPRTLKRRGISGPNPLSIKRAKKRDPVKTLAKETTSKEDMTSVAPAKRKRRKKHPADQPSANHPTSPDAVVNGSVCGLQNASAVN